MWVNVRHEHSLQYKHGAMHKSYEYLPAGKYTVTYMYIYRVLSLVVSHFSKYTYTVMINLGPSFQELAT